MVDRVAALLKKANETPTETDLSSDSDAARRYLRLIVDEAQSLLDDPDAPVRITRLRFQSAYSTLD